MPAGLRRLVGSGADNRASDNRDPITAGNGDLIEIVGDERAPVIEVVEPVVGVGQLGSLTDLELGAVDEPFVLVRDPETGIYHSRPLSQVEARQRGSVVHYIEQDPPQVLPEEWKVGDWVAVIAGDNAGQVYRVVEE